MISCSYVSGYSPLGKPTIPPSALKGREQLPWKLRDFAKLLPSSELKSNLKSQTEYGGIMFLRNYGVYLQVHVK
jgi:hypothetical protein